MSSFTLFTPSSKIVDLKNMDFGSEISQKIKAAIKTKLQDLGSYVDDELPEYIMVMLGNKRSKKQMTEDLMLFLGENTVKFIDWLLNLVDKLKDVTGLIDSLPSDDPISTSDDALNGNKVEPTKPDQDVKQHEARDKKKSSSKTTSKESGQSKSVKGTHSRSEKLRTSSSVSKHAHRKRKMSDSDEEETSVKTQVPSVVKVQEKRPLLPPSKQATSSLLKRAVAEAHLSVTKANPSHSHTYDPTSPPSPIKMHSIEEKRQQKEMLLQQHRELQKQLREKELELEEPKTHDYQNDVHVNEEDVKEVETNLPSSENQTVPPNTTELDNEPLIELQVSEAEALEYSSETIKGDTRIVAFADSQTLNDSEEEKQKRRKKRAVKSRDRPRSPKFIVTLDGVDSDLEDKYEKHSKKSRHKKHKAEVDDYIEVDTSNMVTTAPPITEKPEYMPPAVEQVRFRVDATSDDEEMQQYPLPSKPQERCKFWPDCNNGANCPFYHPTAPCRTFPNCKFADKCMFIHPPCKFDGRCTNVSCPFTHKLKNKLRNPVAAAPVHVPAIEPQIDDSLPTLPQLTPCKFFPGCTRLNCPFLHPKPPNATKVCRYGAACSRMDCKFSHPPSKAALKWVSPSLHLSERAFAVSEESVTKMPVAS